MKLITITISTVLAALITACGSASATTTSPTADDPSNPTLEQRIATTATRVIGEGWLCRLEGPAVNLMHLFLPAGMINGLNPFNQMGIELDPRKPRMDDQIRFLWSETGPASISLDSPDRGIQVELISITFTDNDTIMVDHSVHGQMDCTRETATRTER